MLFCECIPNGTLEAVVFATMSDRKLLTRQVFERHAQQSLSDTFHDAPVMISIQFANPDNSIAKMQFQYAFWQGVELYSPRCLATDRQFVEWLINSRTVDGSRPRGHDDFCGDNPFDSRHRSHNVTCLKHIAKTPMITNQTCLVILPGNYVEC